MFFTEEKLTARTEELARLRYAGMEALAPFTAMESELGKDEVHRRIPDKIEGGAFTLGDEFNGRDRYLWIDTTITLPEHRDGAEVYGRFDLGRTGEGFNSGFESLLYVDGEPYQGVDTFHGEVNFEKHAGKTVRLTFLLWTGLEGGGPRKTRFHRVNMAHVGYLHSEADELYYLARAITGALPHIPDTASEKTALTAALEKALRLVDWEEDLFYGTVGKALASLQEALAAIPKRADYAVAVTGHTHIDVAWLWRLKHTREKAQRSFATVLRFMEEFDDYRFLQTQPQLYSYVKRDNPKLYERIKAAVAEGRWEPDGGMWVEADCNISSGEALVRQLVHGIRFFREEFGKDCEYLWLPDVFGYSWALPQILRQCGIKTFMTTKISWNQYNSIPHDVFTWRGIDGSEILTYFIGTPNRPDAINERFSTYNGVLEPWSVMGSWLKFKDKAVTRETLISYGHGDGGGGPTRHMIKLRRAMDKLPGLPAVKQSSAREFFDRLHENADKADFLATWDGELYLEYHRGTYTSQAENKRCNRLYELETAASEWLASIAALNGGDYPAGTLHDAWEAILLHQFHDIIPGSSIREVYEDSDEAYAALGHSLAEVKAAAFGTLLRQEEGRYTVVNPGSFALTAPVFVATEEDGGFTGADGKVLPAQKTTGGWFVTVPVEPLSFTEIRFTAGAAEEKASPFAVDLAGRTLATPHYDLAWDESGRLTSLFDKANGREVFSAPANQLEIYEDKPLNYDNWDIDIFYAEKRRILEASEAALVENGPERVVLRFSWAYHNSTFAQDMILYRESRRVDFATTADWHEEHRLLKVAFPVDVRSTKATYDIQFGHVERPTHQNTSWDWARFEVVGHKWADLSDAGYGVALLNNCKYGYAIHDGVMRLTLLKSGKLPDTEADMGEHAFTYALLPHAGQVAVGNVIEEATALNLPPYAVSGSPAVAKRLVKLDSAAVQVDAVKLAYDEPGCVVVRLHECRGAVADVCLRSDYRITAYAPCSPLEENLTPVEQGDSVRFRIKPFEMRTFKLWMGDIAK